MMNLALDANSNGISISSSSRIVVVLVVLGRVGANVLVFFCSIYVELEVWN